MYLQFFAVLLIVFWKLWDRWKHSKEFKLSKVLQSRYPAYPIVGHAMTFLGDNETRMDSLIKFGREAIENQHGIISFWAGPNQYAMICDAVAIERVLKGSIEKTNILDIFRFITGNGLVFAPAAIWRPRRKVMAPVFSQKHLNHYVDIFVKQNNVMLEKLEIKVDSAPFSIWDYVSSSAMDSVCETTLGIQQKTQEDTTQPFLKSFKSIINLAMTRLSRPWLHSDILFRLSPDGRKMQKHKDAMYDFIGKIIQKTRLQTGRKKTEFQEQQYLVPDGSNTLKTFLQLISTSSDGGNFYTDWELSEEILVLLLAGTDTLTAGTSFATVLLSRYQDVQEKVFKELQGIFGDSNRPIEVSDLPKMKYLECVIKESIRLYPPAAVVDRKLTKDIELPSGITLHEGLSVFIHIWGVQHNPRYWGPDVEEFKPERFMKGPLEHPSSFVAFSYGPRNCLGYQYAIMSMKVSLAGLIRKFQLLPVKFTEDDDFRKPLRLKFEFTTKHVHDFKIQLNKRQ